MEGVDAAADEEAIGVFNKEAVEEEQVNETTDEAVNKTTDEGQVDEAGGTFRSQVRRFGWILRSRAKKLFEFFLS